MARTREEPTRREEAMTIKTRKVCKKCGTGLAVSKAGECFSCAKNRCDAMVEYNCRAELRYPVKGKGRKG